MKKLQQLSSSPFLKLLFFFSSLAFLLCAVILPDRGQMFSGLWKILSSTCKVATNTFDLGGFSAAFLNAGIVGLLCTALFLLPKAKASAPSVIGYFLTVGFSFWGLNAVNIWFGMFGVALYCLVKRESLGSQVNAMIFTTGLSPLYSDLLLRFPNAEAVGFHWTGLALAVGVGIFVGFFLPAGLAYAANVHKGFDLYSAAVPVGMTAFFLRALLYQVLGGTLPGGATTSLEVGSRLIVNVFCISFFLLCVLFALLMGCKAKDYWRLMRESGHSSDFVEKYGKESVLMNMGIYGLFIMLYYNLVGASFNAVTLGCVFCMLACCASDSHPGNVWPIMVGYVGISYLCKYLAVGEYAQAINAQAIVIGLCFASGLSPISGKYGWPFGIIAGAMHFVLVTSVPALHGGFCLYNGGLTAAFICLLFVPVLQKFCKTKEERKALRNK